jgi:hypothetical protein
MRLGLALVAAMAMTTAIVPSSANARVVGITLTQTRVFQRLVLNPQNQGTPRPTPLPGDLLVSRYNLQWLGNRLGFAPQPWPVGVAVAACRITAFPHAQCAARYTLVGGGRILAAGPVNLLARATQRVRIVGGTKRYQGARGSISVQPKTPTVRVLRFTVITP